MLKYPTPCPILTTSASLGTSNFQPCEPEGLHFTKDIQHVIQKAPSNTIPNQGKGIDQQGDNHIRKKRRRRTIWVPSDDTTILTIHPGIQSDAKGLNDTLLKVVNQPHATERRQKKPLAAALKRAPLQPTLKPLQESEDQQGSYI